VVGSSDIYTVTFNNTTDTEADPQTMEVIEGQSLDALPAEPNKDLHIFKECNTVEDGTGDIFTANTPVNTDITVFAQWERIVIENLSITASGPNPVYTEDRIVLETTLNIMGTGNTPISYSEVVANYNLD
ncbi:MAG: InlB B-repeat-containing protein, partial [Halanaerobiales bacterium]